MANLDNPNGFLPLLSPGDSGGGQPMLTYFVLNDTNALIGKGDLLTWTSGRVDQAAASNALIGVAAEPKKASAGTSILIAVWANPQQLFVSQTDNGTGTLTAITDIGLNADFIVTAASDNQSNMEIDEDSGNTTATLPLKIMRLSDEKQRNADNAFGEFNRLVVKINNHQLQGHTGTAGT